MSVSRVKQPRWQLTGLAMALAAAGMFHSPQVVGDDRCPDVVEESNSPCTFTGTYSEGVFLKEGAAAVNEGTIEEGEGTVSIQGSMFSFTNAANGIVRGTDAGIVANASIQTLTNEGLIEVTTDGAAAILGRSGSIVNLTNKKTIKGVVYSLDSANPLGLLDNQEGASIRSKTAPTNPTDPNSVPHVVLIVGNTEINNAGVIAARLTDDVEYTDSSYGLTVRGGTVTITNQRTGVIGGGDAGLQVGTSDVAAQASITNAGTIEGSLFGMVVRKDTVVSELSNSAGAIIRGGRSFGVFVDNGTIETLTNSGTITGGNGRAIIVNGGTITTLTNEATGKIEGNVTGGNVGTLTNKGLIDGEVSVTSAATLNIEGDSARITGAVTAASSTVNVKGTFTTENTFEVDVFNIATGGTLTLAHKITTGPNSFHNDGTLIVAAGTQNIVGNFTTTGTFSPVIVDMDNYGKLAVDGDVALGGTLKANNGVTVEGLIEGTLTDIISYTGSRTGEFDEVLGANDLFEWSAEYDDAGKRVNLVLEQTLPGFYESVSTAGFVPAYQAALALDAVALTDGTNPVVLSFVNVPQAQVADAVVQTLPLLTGNSQLAAMNALNDIDDAVKARLAFNRGELTDDAMFTDRKVWIRPFGSWVDQKNRGDYYGYSGSTGGLVIGADTNLATGLQMGLAFGYANSSVTGNKPIKSNTYDLDTYQVLGYGRYELGQGTELEFQAGVGMNKNKGTRQLSLQGTTAKSSYDSTTATAGLGLRHQLRLNTSTTFTPEVRADYGWISDAGYTETGAQALNLIVQGRDHDQLMLSAGGYASYEVQKGLALRAGLALGYDALNSQARITSAYSGAPQTTFVTSGIDPSPWQLMGSLSLVGELANGMQVSATYGASYRQDFLNQNVSVNLRIGF